jgi:hypothetical protein
MATTTVTGSVQTGAAFQYTNRAIMPADVTATTSYADLTGLQFYAKAGNVYRFRFTVMTTAALTTDGHAVSISGPASPTFLAYTGTQPTGAATQVVTNGAAFDLPAAQTTTTAATAGNIHTVEGYIQPATSGNIVGRIIADNTSVVAKGYLSSVEWTRVG